MFKPQTYWQIFVYIEQILWPDTRKMFVSTKIDEHNRTHFSLPSLILSRLVGLVIINANCLSCGRNFTIDIHCLLDIWVAGDKTRGQFKPRVVSVYSEGL